MYQDMASDPTIPYSCTSDSDIGKAQTIQEYTLIKALTAFIVPLIRETSCRLCTCRAPQDIPTLTPDPNHPRQAESHILTKEAERLITALGEFNVASLYRSGSGESVHSVPSESEQASNLNALKVSSMTANQSDSKELVTSVKETISSETSPTDEEKQFILSSALAEARNIIFNKMPIRMLVFNTKGTDIELVERAEIYQHVSTQMEREINGFRKDELRESLKKGSQEHQRTIKDLILRHTGYIILSHTWSQGVLGEMTYADWIKGKYDAESAAYSKLSNFCRVAATEYGVSLGWMDTVCINKDSSSELDESIRSMYKWYQKASACVAYLAQTTLLEDMSADAWFTRGWTLQELIAPRSINFYTRNWTLLGTKGTPDKHNKDIQAQILRATSITGDELNSRCTELIPISRRMQWAAKRHVTREEDTAYSLMGIFDVSISIAYGEGAHRAFSRLVREIMSVADRNQHVLDIANWGTGPGPRAHLRDQDVTAATNNSISFLIPSGPQVYAFRSDAILWPYDTAASPMTLTRLGIQVPVLLMPTLRIGSGAWTSAEDGSSADAFFEPQGNFFGVIKHSEYQISFNILDSRVFDQSSMRWNAGDVIVDSSQSKTIVLAVLNFRETEFGIEIPYDRPCFAIMLAFKEADISSSNQFTPLPARKPITFQMDCYGPPSYKVPKYYLHKHGIAYRTLHL